MKIINKYIFKELITPFFLSLFILLFVLITQFFIKNIDRFIGKGLSISIILKYLLFNSAWIFSLAVPIAVLIATMMAFGRLSSDNEIAALKSSGISYAKILKPAALFGIILVTLMIPFNLWILPEMNFNHKILTQEVSRSRPDIQIQSHQKNIIFNKIIYVGEETDGQFNNITIFDNHSDNNISIFSESGNFTAFNDGVLLNLKNGTLHSYNQKTDEYQKTFFDNYQISIPYNEMNLNNSNLLRNDREMNISTLLKKISTKKDQIKLINKNIINSKKQLDLYSSKEKNIQLIIDSLKSIDELESTIYNSNFINLNKIKNKISNLNIKINNNANIVPQHLKDVNKSYVEIHKKIALPFACLIFILLGMPLGIISKNGKFSINIAISLIFIIIYWSFITIGEYLADENKLDPMLAMWAGNFIMTIIALYLFKNSANENQIFNLRFINIKTFFKPNKLTS